MKKTLSSCLCGLVVLLCACDAARILVWFPIASKSHSILGKGVVRHLLKEGHEVVHVTAFPENDPVDRLKEISVQHVAGKVMQKAIGERFKLKNQISNQENLGHSYFFLELTYNFHKHILETEEVTRLLGDPLETFDVVVLEWFFSEIISGIAPLFRCPAIYFGTTEAHWQILSIIDETPNPSYNVDLFSSETPPLDLWGRVNELYIMIKKYFMHRLWVQSQEELLYNQIFTSLAAKRGVQMPSFEEVKYNASFLFINSHPSVGTPFRLPMNVKYVGGFHVNENVPALPEDLQKMMDNAKHGIIYFSMGSNLKSEDMTEDMKRSILDIFRGMKENVIWKFDGELDDVPRNVKLLKWVPQQSVLAHPNLKIFITHGGQLSTTEAIHYGVPLIGIPVFGDQHVNMKAVVAKGFGIKLKLAENLAEQMKQALNEMFGNNRYSKKAKEISRLYHDRPIPPGQELTFWIRHVIETKGALHLRSSALLVSWHQKMFLDVLGILVILVILVYYLMMKLVICCMGRKLDKVKKK